MDAGGFDAVIGNPPYGADYTEAEKEYFQSRYVYKKGKPETYIFFTEKGIALSKVGGVLGYITPNAWLTNHYGIQLRGYLFVCSFGALQFHSCKLVVREKIWCVDGNWRLQNRQNSIASRIDGTRAHRN
jgi:hypothetical protein